MKGKFVVSVTVFFSIIWRLVITQLYAQSVVQSGDHDQFRISPYGYPFITNFKSDQYNAHPNNYGIVQDKNGVLYFANLWGVMEFDGITWTKIPLGKKNSCTALALDNEGTIYVAGRNEIGYLEKDAIGHKHYVSLVKYLQADAPKNFNEVWRILVANEGIYFSTNKYLFFKPSRESNIQLLSSNSLNAFHVNGKIYATGYDGIFEVQNSHLVALPNTNTLKGLYINAVTALGNKLVISTSENGLYLYDGQILQLWNCPLNLVLRQYNPNKISNFRDKYLIISTDLGGLFVTDLNGNILMKFDKQNGLTANTVANFFFDIDNNLWLTLSNSISLIQLFKPYVQINDNAGVSGVPYSSAVFNNKLYLATTEGLYYRELNDAAGTYVKHNEVTGLIWNLTVIGDELFCGHAISARVINKDNKSKTLFNSGTWTFVPVKERNEIIIGTYDGLHVLKSAHSEWKYSHKIEGFDESARYVVCDKNGDLWVSHSSKGVYQLRIGIDGKHVTKSKLHAEANDMPLYSSYVTMMDGKVFVASEAGVFWFDDNHDAFVKDANLSALASAVPFKKIFPSDKETLWAIDHNGTIIKILKRGERYVSSYKIGIFHGKLIDEFEHLYTIDDNNVVAGTQDGFVLVRARTDVGNVGEHLKTFISNARITDADSTISHEHASIINVDRAIPYRLNALAFTFSCNSYEFLKENRYSYFLEGYNTRSWSQWSASTAKEYTNLHYGKYALHVRVMNHEGVIGKEAVLRFEILPPWYKTWWAYIFYFICLVAAALVIAGKIRQRFRREKKKIIIESERQLWNKQKEWEAQELEREKKMLALEQEKLHMEALALEQKEQLIDQEKKQERQLAEMEKEKLEAEIHFKNQELTSLTFNITHNAELLNGLRLDIKQLKSKVQEGEILTALNQLEQSISKELNSSDDWKKFSENFDLVHAGFLKRLQAKFPDLKSTSLKLCAYIKMRLSSKQIAILMNTEPASVNKGRYRLRAKFNLETDESLENFLDQI